MDIEEMVDILGTFDEKLLRKLRRELNPGWKALLHMINCNSPRFIKMLVKNMPDSEKYLRSVSAEQFERDLLASKMLFWIIQHQDKSDEQMVGHFKKEIEELERKFGKPKRDIIQKSNNKGGSDHA